MTSANMVAKVSFPILIDPSSTLREDFCILYLHLKAAKEINHANKSAAYPTVPEK